jgi:hypothetical protein
MAHVDGWRRSAHLVTWRDMENCWQAAAVRSYCHGRGLPVWRSAMSTVNWGGKFSAMDAVRGLRVRGQMYGQLDGSFSLAREPELKALTLMVAQDALSDWQPGVLAAATAPGDFAVAVTRQLAETLGPRGIPATVTIAAIHLDPDTLAQLQSMESELAKASAAGSGARAAVAPQAAPAALVAQGAPPPQTAGPGAWTLGAGVLVACSDGNRYPGVVQESQHGQCLVAFSNGSQHWVAFAYLSPRAQVPNE